MKLCPNLVGSGRGRCRVLRPPSQAGRADPPPSGAAPSHHRQLLGSPRCCPEACLTLPPPSLPFPCLGKKTSRRLLPCLPPSGPQQLRPQLPFLPLPASDREEGLLLGHLPVFGLGPFLTASARFPSGKKEGEVSGSEFPQGQGFLAQGSGAGISR